MVKSTLDDNVEYIETRDKDSDDLGLNSSVYETTLYDIPVNFLLGNPKYTYRDNNIVYYPIYLVQNDKIVAQIGVYELLANEQQSKYDEDGDIDLNKLDSPLLYEFTYSLLTKKDKSISEKSQSKAKSIGNAKGNWIKEYMSDDDYDIVDTAYDGNCFFNVLKMAIEDAAEENDPEISIEDMRDILAAEANEDLFLHYKFLYEEQTQAQINLPLAIKQNSAQMKTLATKIKTLKDRNLLNTSLTRYDGLKETNERLKREQRAAEENLVDCRFMAGIENLEMLKLKMKTREYWADAWAIATLERELGIKTIILSELNYKDGDLNNIIQCGDTLPNPDTFKPAFYVLVCYYGGYHYQMITYKNDKSFTYEEIPEEIKRLVVDKCLEKIAGPYSFIPEFKNYALRLKTAQAQAQAQAREEEAIVVSSASSTSSEKEPLEETSSDLYDAATTFRFYSKSSDRPLPGKGQGESLGPEGKEAYKELSKIPDWRKKLANSWKAEFKLDGHRWASVEHYYQAAKFKRNNKDFYIKFSLDSPDSSIAKDPEMAKAAGGQSGKFKGDQVRDKHIVVDPDFFSSASASATGASATGAASLGAASLGAKYMRGELEMEAAMRAKFTQNADLKSLLIATKKAKLERANHGKPGTVLNHLMRVRRELQTSATSGS